MPRNTLENIEDPSGTTLKVVEVLKNDWQRSVHVLVTGESVEAHAPRYNFSKDRKSTIKFQSPDELTDFVEKLSSEQVQTALDAFEGGTSENLHVGFSCGSYGRDCGYLGIASGDFYIGKRSTHANPHSRLEDPRGVLDHLAEVLRNYE